MVQPPPVLARRRWMSRRTLFAVATLPPVLADVRAAALLALVPLPPALAKLTDACGAA